MTEKLSIVQRIEGKKKEIAILEGKYKEVLLIVDQTKQQGLELIAQLRLLEEMNASEVVA